VAEDSTAEEVVFMEEEVGSTAAVEVEVFMEVVAGSTVGNLRRSGPVS
jgi:hypothetical protein